MAVILCMILGTVAFIVFLYLFISADEGIVRMMIESCVETQDEELKTVRMEMERLAEKAKKTGDIEDKKIKKGAKKLKKRYGNATKLSEIYRNGKISGLDMIPIVGYRLMQLLKWDSSNKTVKELYKKCCHFQEKKEAMHRTYYLLGALFGYVFIGVGAFFVSLAITLSLGMAQRGLIVALVVLVVFGVMGYVPYDNVSAIVLKREEEIGNQFPQVVSKLALLTVAGMEVSRAWRVTGQSGEGTLYNEMNRVMLDLQNNVSPVEAYAKFIQRCDNKYTTKLGTSIIQNISKGNSEIVRLFRSLNDESWMEHKHSARRMGEKIQSKLMIPTILMFLGILILVIVPVMSGFGI